MKKSPREANTITLQLYEVKNDTAHQVSEEKKWIKGSSDDIYEESNNLCISDGGESPRLNNTNGRQFDNTDKMKIPPY